MDLDREIHKVKTENKFLSLYLHVPKFNWKIQALDRNNVNKLKMFKRIVLSTALIRKGGKYLLLKRTEKAKTNKLKWQFPEGKLEFGETPEQALKREVKEESGLTVTKAKLKAAHASVLFLELYGRIHVVRIIYDCKARGKIRLSSEHAEFGWFAKNEIKKLDLAKGFEWKDLRKYI